MNYRLIFSTIALASFTLLSAQKDFASLSAKQRIDMAAQEVVESESDADFQALMKQGMQHFEANQFEDAISQFSKAGELRPINVYPPVMIEDVRSSMEAYVPVENQDEAIEEEALTELVSPEDEEPKLTSEERVELMYQAELAKVYAELPPAPKEKKPEKPAKPVELDAEGLVVKEQRAEVQAAIETDRIILTGEEEEPSATPAIKEPIKVTKPATAAVQPQENLSIEELQESLALDYEDGITEETFKEGNREVTRRVVVKGGQGNEYRKVKHAWGGVFFFKNGTSITERIWKEETE